MAGRRVMKLCLDFDWVRRPWRTRREQEDKALQRADSPEHPASSASAVSSSPPSPFVLVDPSSPSFPPNPIAPPPTERRYPLREQSIFPSDALQPLNDLPSPEEVRSRAEVLQVSGHREATVWRIEWGGRTMVVKGGRDVEVSEAEITVLAGKTTDLPVSQVFGATLCGDETFIYFEHLPGTPLIDAWLSLLPSSRENFQQQLRAALTTLKSTRAPPGTLLGGYGGSNLHALATGKDEAAPPFLDSSAFHSWLYDTYCSHGLFPFLRRRRWRKRIAPHLTFDSPLVLTHGDLSICNLLVDGEGNLTGVIDWERGGFYPPWVDALSPAVPYRHRWTHENEVIIALEAFRAAGGSPNSYKWLFEMYKGCFPEI
ncbi:hypothetical protein JCM6882_009133 [Rhodosporidiobolus microsporus]